MQADKWIEPDETNETAYDNLIVAVEASQGVMSLLLAVCDDIQFRETIIHRYEAEIQPQIRSYRITLPRENPSLRQALAQQVAQDAYLQEGGQAVLTVTGAEQLSFLKLGQEKSEQDVFLGYLQWTREGLREFKFPIILWVTSQLLAKLSRKAPDFWSWRKDVFRFICQKTQIAHHEDVVELLPLFEQWDLSKITEDDEIPIQDLEELISTTEARQPDDPLLATLYSSLARIYAQRVARGEAQNDSLEINRSIELSRKAIALQEIQNQELDLAVSLSQLASLYCLQGHYNEVEPLLVRSLAIEEQLLGESHPIVALSLNHLASFYGTQERYTEAEALLARSIAIQKQQLGENHPDVAQSFMSLALLYYAQERYMEAELLNIKAMEIYEQQLGSGNSRVALGLNNLAKFYESQKRFAEAASLYTSSLKISEKTLGADHPNTITVRENLARLHQFKPSSSISEFK